MTTQLKQPPKFKAQAIPFINLKSQQDRIRPQIDQAIKRVLDHNQYIMGPEVFALEEALAAKTGAKHAVTCASGTDALLMLLMAQKIGPGNAVLIPSFTFPATPEAVVLLGATPIFVDVLPDTFNVDPDAIESGIRIAKQHKLCPKGILAVDLFGQPANYPEIEAIAYKQGLWIFADAAQSFGARLHHRNVGTLANATATSFFPAKPLGCYGDGGAILTNTDHLADLLRSIRVHGKGQHKYDNVRIGLNARLDTLQAAILLEKLKIFDDELNTRHQIAMQYNNVLQNFIQTPQLIEGATSAWAQYTITLPSQVDRTQVIRDFEASGIPTMIYYAKPLHQQTAYQHFPTSTGKGTLPVSEQLAKTVLSLPFDNTDTLNTLATSAHILKEATLT